VRRLGWRLPSAIVRGVVGNVAGEAERVFSGDVSEGGSRGPCRDLVYSMDRRGRHVR
jgi:hypothetical protein